MPVVSQDSVVTHISAAVLWGLPVPQQTLDRVHLTRSQPTGMHIGPALHVHGGRFDPAEAVELNGLRVSSLEQSAMDAARCVRPPEALAILDAARRLGAEPDELARVGTRSRRQHGVQQANWALRHSDGRSESVGESHCRYWMISGVRQQPVLQLEIRDGAGRLVCRSDFGWPERGVLGEFDGRVKYGELLRPGESPTDAVMREKRRENALRNLGWWVLRWTWSDLADGPAFIRQLNEFLGSRAA